MTNDDQSINGDIGRRVVVDTGQMPWSTGFRAGVEQKVLHRVGPVETAQLTAIVRYEPGTRLPRQDTLEGEETLVLEGTLSNKQGDWPAGSYLLNPAGFHHSSWTEQGCTLFVKLRQYPGSGRDQIAVQSRDLPWQLSVRRNAQWKKLYAQEPYTDFMRLEAWDTPAELGQLNFPRGVELLVIKGGFADALGQYDTHSWLRIPAGGSLAPSSDGYCELYIKEGGFTYLQQAPEAELPPRAAGA
ncbi:MAG: cupin domain-containing protein [Parahaliea sp.]